MSEFVDVGLIEEIIELVGVAIDAFGVLVILTGIGLATYRYLSRQYHKRHRRPYLRYKFDIGLTLLLGLEILVAADIIKSLAVEPSFHGLGVLAGLIVIRTFLSWVIVLEIEGRWPWQPESNVVQKMEVENE